MTKYAACLLLLLSCRTACGGSVRYELPSLLGEHLFDGGLVIFTAADQINTPFGFYAVERATLVLEGRVSQGLAHGDGVIREGSTFDLLPSVYAYPSFDHTIAFTSEPTSHDFRLETTYSYPFVPDTTPLPNPDGYPPVSFSVYLSVRPNINTAFPMLVDPLPDTLSSGIVVDVPIVANIEPAYIVLSGDAIVPEPSGAAVACGLIALFALCRTGHRVLPQVLPQPPSERPV